MPRYEYRCEECGHTFEIQELISEHEKRTTLECPECGSGRTRQLPSRFFAETSKKS